MVQLPDDCLIDIFECLEKVEDADTLRSCLLVNRLWCQISVEILWKSNWNYDTLFTFLPHESKEILSKNEIIISTSISKPPIFNYVSFCKVLSINLVNFNIWRFVSRHKSSSLTPKAQDLYVIRQEIFKLLMNQASFKRIDFDSTFSSENETFDSFPRARDALKNISELRCYDAISFKFLYQLSQICHNIQSMTIGAVPKGLIELIFAQKNLKHLTVVHWDYCKCLNHLLTKLPNTLITLSLSGGNVGHASLSFITKLTLLQEITFSFGSKGAFEDFNELQDVTFSQLQILRFEHERPRKELLTRFLKNNGKNLKELYVNFIDYSLELAIVMYCPNLRKNLFTKDNIESIKNDFESIKISG